MFSVYVVVQKLVSCLSYYYIVATRLRLCFCCGVVGELVLGSGLLMIKQEEEKKYMHDICVCRVGVGEVVSTAFDGAL